VNYEIRDFVAADATEVNAVALAAFAEFQTDCTDWPRFSAGLGNTASLAQSAELIVASCDLGLMGAVAYVGPGRPKAPFFKSEWPIIRMLVVRPSFRGQGIGRALTEECMRRALRDGASVIALHTSPVMKVALAMYQRMGFQWVHEGPGPPIFGVPYGIYVKQLAAA